MYQLPKRPYSYFLQSLEFHLKVLFSCEHLPVTILNQPEQNEMDLQRTFLYSYFFFLIASWIGLFYQIGCTYFYLFVISLTHEKLRMLSPLSIVSYTCSLLYN